MTGHKNDKAAILDKLKINSQSGCVEWIDAIDHGGYCVYEKLKAEESLSKHYNQRAEKAEAKAKQLIKKLTYNTPSFRDGECDENLLTIDENELVPLKSCMCDRLEQAEAQNKRMQTAINRYVIGNIDLLDALKAALEEKT